LINPLSDGFAARRKRMKSSRKLTTVLGGIFLFSCLIAAGCTSEEAVDATATPVSEESDSTDHHEGEAGHDHDHDHEDGHATHQHGEWWCGEHGVPEEECALCDTSLVSKFKEEGDWCDDHNRPDSQCFICHPENFEKYAALYEAKFGERPEMPTE